MVIDLHIIITHMTRQNVSLVENEIRAMKECLLTVWPVQAWCFYFYSFSPLTRWP